MTKKLIALLIAMTLVFGSAAPACANSSLAVTENAGEEQTTQATDTQEIGSTGGTNNTSDLNNSENAEDTTTPEKATEAADAEDTANEKDDQDDQDKEDKKQTTTISKYQKGLAAYIRSKNKNLSKSWSITLAGYFIKSGKKNDVDPKVLMALALRESNFRAKAKSKYGYKGIMQLSDAFARRYGYKPSDLYKASVSIEIAAKYIKKMKKKYKTYTNAICCYICGSGSVANGTHSKEPGRSVMNVRSGIKKFLKKNGYT